MSAILRRTVLGAPLLGFLWAKAPATLAAPAPDREWTTCGAELAWTRCAPLDQINATDFTDLEVAWRLKSDNFGAGPGITMQSTPLVAKGRMYTTVGTRRDVVALDAATGELLWMFRLPE